MENKQTTELKSALDHVLEMANFSYENSKKACAHQEFLNEDRGAMRTVAVDVFEALKERDELKESGRIVVEDNERLMRQLESADREIEGLKQDFEEMQKLKDEHYREVAELKTYKENQDSWLDQLNDQYKKEFKAKEALSKELYEALTPLINLANAVAKTRDLDVVKSPLYVFNEAKIMHEDLSKALDALSKYKQSQKQ